MLKINGLEITKETFEDLLRSIKSMKQNLKEGNVKNVEFTLDVLESHLEHNLLADEVEDKEVA